MSGFKIRSITLFMHRSDSIIHFNSPLTISRKGERNYMLMQSHLKRLLVILCLTVYLQICECTEASDRKELGRSEAWWHWSMWSSVIGGM